MIVVKFKTDDYGDKWDDKYWHYIQSWGDADRALCSGHVIGKGESIAEFIKKDGRITCPWCIRIIKEIKDLNC